MEAAGISAVDTPTGYRHWPESSIKSSQANAGNGMLLLRARRRQTEPSGCLPFVWRPGGDSRDGRAHP